MATFISQIRKESKKMKKIVSVLALTLLLMMAFAVSAMAAQNLDPNAVKGDGVSDYQATPKTTSSAYPDGIYIEKDANGIAKPIHSGYQANTDACASCHATHTAVGASLLQWATVSDACYACHDGTITDTYDVNNGMIGATGARTFGGAFNMSSSDAIGNATSVSRHNVGTVNISAAPGGNATGTADANGTWDVEFECTSCHAPHGTGGNFRILNPDANGVAMASKVVKEAATTTDSKTFKATKADWLKGYPYSTYTGVYVGADAATAAKIATGFTQDYRNGTVTFASTPAGNVYLSYVPGLRITGTVTNKLTANEDVQYNTGLNGFCGACHTDYNTEKVTGSGSNVNGTYTEAYRHQVGMQWHGTVPGLKFGQNSEVECLTCHVAHGTDTSWWTDWKVKSGWTGTVTTEDAGSSALKRLPNMSACDSCHQKSAAANY